MNLLELDRVDGCPIDLVGGKAAGLGAALRSGERVPAGFCLTTEAFPAAGTALAEVPAELATEIVQAYRRLGGGPVAVRSSATAEDLPWASFAGQQDTFLDVCGADDVLRAVLRCWASLRSERAVQYRRDHEIDDGGLKMAVVVQRMVRPVVAGVLFTANPVTGNRTELVVAAGPGLGTAVVEGTGHADHYVLDHRAAAVASGCLSAAQLHELRELGLRLQARSGSPQDVEWAIDGDGTLWLLQSRPITTLFPLPPRTGDPRLRLYVSNGPVQGMLQPYTPMGMWAMKASGAAMWDAAGLPDRTPATGAPVDIGGRMYVDVTTFLWSKAARAYLGEGWLGGAAGMAVVDPVPADPRFAPQPDRLTRWRTVGAVALRVGPAAVAGIVGTLVRPHAARERATRVAARLERRTTAATGLTTAQRLRFVESVQAVVMDRAMGGLLWPVVAGFVASGVPVRLLQGIATPSEVETVLRGMPHNVTTEMNLHLWRLAAGAGRHRDLLLHTPPAELADLYLAGQLPDLGIAEFLAAYGRRAVAELDVGVPRWSQDPTSVFAALANYLRVTDPQQAPDLRFTRASDHAEATLAELVSRARRVRPVRARVAGFLLRRARAVSGLRELPKFVWLHALAQLREQLLLVGSELAGQGRLRRADDVMFLDLDELRSALDGTDVRDLVATRRAVHARELRRRYVPSVLLSDGTDPERLVPPTAPGDGVLTGIGGAPGRYTGTARVIHDPAGARVEPGDILVVTTTDPGWTPLFLTTGALVTETGTPIAHGPTVAREYGIPVVVGVRDATRLITTGRRITVDGSAGTVTMQVDPSPLRTGSGDGA